jgi:hypothetical protein
MEQDLMRVKYPRLYRLQRLIDGQAKEKRLMPAEVTVDGLDDTLSADNRDGVPA